MTAMNPFLLFLAFLGPQDDPQSIQDQLQRSLRKNYPELSDDRRTELARQFAQGILQARAFGHDPARVLQAVEGKLTLGKPITAEMRAYSESRAARVGQDLPGGASSLILPDSFPSREVERNLEGIGHYLTETAARRSSTEDEKQAIVRQLQVIGDEIRSAARTRISGPFRDALIEKNVDSVLKRHLGKELGDPVGEGLTRPLTEQELAVLLGAIREDAARLPAAEASSPEDQRFAASGVLDLGEETPAMRTVSNLALRIYAFGEFNYPKMMAALRERDQVVVEAAEWMRSAWERANAELEKKGARTFKVDPPVPSNRAGRLPPPLKVPAAGGKEKPDGGPETSDTPRAASSRGPWIVGGLVILAAIGYLLWRRSRSPA